MNGKVRILINTMATYVRTLVAIGLGLFTTRWVLEALGQSDFGLYGIVGALLVFITFLNTISSSGIARFYAYSIGKGQQISCEQVCVVDGDEVCCRLYDVGYQDWRQDDCN